MRRCWRFGSLGCGVLERLFEDGDLGFGRGDRLPLPGQLGLRARECSADLRFGELRVGCDDVAPFV